ncbi:D-alanyl-D-alanine carboxypeptidase family protein [Bacillus kwashiorkori]|uniref:D-alanyl-D-alanine carboxypeptidase family protein n=1 Tax=Bacillus kwashiorkori TaxID=1522318 RepID=UPI000780ABE5|nr:D-alanyl-D-alanine carboxypeptidase family protein [Bacillus kwashiorkori]
MGFKIRRLIIIISIIAIAVSLLPNRTNAFAIQSYSAILMDQKTGRVFYERNAHEKRRIASITKIMTAIIAIESNKLSELVTVSERAVYTEGSSVFLKIGEKISLEDLVYGLMLRSGNDAAVAIAEHVGGSIEGFVYLMNEKAKQIGMKNTNFANPHGLDDHENHYSSAYDMALLTKYAMNNEKFQEISRTKVHHAPNPDSKWQRKWTNKHRLVTGMYKYTTGGKTGYTKRAKRTLVTTASKNGMDLIAVTLNSPSSGDWNEHISLFDYVFNHYELTEVLQEGPIKGIKHSPYKNRAYLETPYHFPLTEKEMAKIEVNYRLMKPKKEWKKHPEKVPKIIGRAEVYFENRKVHTKPIYYYYEEKNEKTFLQWTKYLFNLIIGVKNND